jgi:redox-sensitive bicupin YhaK (pirin superfamily)
MFAIRKSSDRGHFDHGWLDTFHTFSFSDYFDPQHMGFRSLRVMNEDRVAAGMGFPTHGHHDMEIVTYVLSGALQHKDSLGHGEVLRPGEFQHMSAGSGIRHSEFNPSESEPVHLYQIWLLPREKGLKPSYGQKTFDPAGRQNQWQLVASPDGAAGSLPIQQDASILLANLDAGRELSRDILAGRHAWLQVLRGNVQLGEHNLSAGDGVAVSNEASISITAPEPAELMYFDLP